MAAQTGATVCRSSRRGPLFLVAGAVPVCRARGCDLGFVERKLFGEAPLKNPCCSVRRGSSHLQPALVGFNLEAESLAELLQGTRAVPDIEGVRQGNVVKLCGRRQPIAEGLSQRRWHESECGRDVRRKAIASWVGRGNADRMQRLAFAACRAKEDEGAGRPSVGSNCSSSLELC